MTAQELEDKVFEKAKEYGLFTQNMKDSGKRGVPNAVKRSNIKSDAYKDGKAYFGFVRPEEAPSGMYYDLSFIIFPQQDGGKCVISLCVGSAGFQRDFDLATRAGTRRLFTRLTKNDGYSFIKNDFTDIETSSEDLLDKLNEDDDLNDLITVIDTYKKCLPASRIVDPDTEFDVIEAWLAQYAKLRGWKMTKPNQKAADKAIANCSNIQIVDHIKEIKRLLDTRKYVVLQGAPGTGKTYSALEISKGFAKTHFIQFHAETTYSDFVEGIRPKLDTDNISYEKVKGELVNSIESAKSTEGKVLLIIDEINRANLANVLGPIFYLFEHQTGERKVTINVGGEEIAELPKNLYVIATMNTADRSLAVVDFALRRRFAWYTIKPQPINPEDGDVFHEELFNAFCEIFDEYATDEELNLQPGPSYFLTSADNADEIMKDRMIYELMPLIKEYLSEGLMRKASDRFSHLFYETTGLLLFE